MLRRHLVARAQAQIGRLLITPAATLALVSGLYLAGDRGYFDRIWVQVPMAILIVLLGLGGAFFSPDERRAADPARRDPGGAEHRALSARVCEGRRAGQRARPRGDLLHGRQARRLLSRSIMMRSTLVL